MFREFQSSVPSQRGWHLCRDSQEHQCPRLHKSTLVNLVLPLCFRKASLWHLNFGKLRQQELLRVESLALGIQEVHALLS